MKLSKRKLERKIKMTINEKSIVAIYAAPTLKETLERMLFILGKSSPETSDLAS